jgi:TRAP-type C4-dicarboxylate transport system permease small subunit
VSLSSVIVICVTALLIALIWASTKYQPKGK